MVKMPTDDLILVGVRFLYDGIIHDDDPIFLLDLAYLWFDQAPPLFGAHFGTG